MELCDSLEKTATEFLENKTTLKKRLHEEITKFKAEIQEVATKKRRAISPTFTRCVLYSFSNNEDVSAFLIPVNDMPKEYVPQKVTDIMVREIFIHYSKFELKTGRTLPDSCKIIDVQTRDISGIDPYEEVDIDANIAYL